ncbi:ATP synthase regulation protein NCA2-domain-containing protein [Chlamydoabsidia padenii]|nr:ATP synthase regulation protein NCA2-domain-containing protein [Chlamydoabsidia padenii]
MAAYAIEQVQRLNASLLEIQREHLCSTTTILSSSNTSLTPKQAWEAGDKTQFLLTAIQAVDASLTGVPQLKDINNYLALYTSLKKDTNNQVDDNTLDWLFVTKCTLAIYGHSVSSILQSTLPLSESLAYWNNIYGNVWYEVYYGLQTAPHRLYSLVVKTRQMLLDTTFTSSSTTIGIKTLLTSSDHVLSGLFPLALRDRRSSTLHPLSAHSSKPLTEVFRKLYHSPLPLALIRDEIQQKKATLTSFRTQQSTTLGLLIKQAPRFESSSDLQVTSLDQLARGTSQCVKALTSCFRGDSAGVRTSLNDNMNIQAMIDDIEQSGRNFTMTSACPFQVANDLKSIVDSQSDYQTQLQWWKKEYGSPSSLTRHWIPALMIVFGGKIVLNYVCERKDDIKAWANEGMETIHGFVVNWLWEPILGILDTIRCKDQRMGLSSKEGLKSDLQSLERMVVQFAKDHYRLSEPEIAQLSSQVRDGDVSLVLRAYENEIKHPLKNAIRGDLIQTLLIQVQKTKVDVDMAMQALDKLLKSNELNFAFLAVAPSMLLTWASASWLKNIYQKRDGNRIQQIGQPLKDTLRRIERLFTLDPTENELSCESQGALLCELLVLRNYAHYLPTRNSIRESFTEDIRDLEAVRLSKRQKMETVGRMYHSWNFLS